MVLFVSFEDILLLYQIHPFSAVSYLIAPMLSRPSTYTLVCFLMVVLINILCPVQYSIVNFGLSFSDDQVTITHSGSATAGETYSLTCSTVLIQPLPLPSSVPTPNFQWFCGPHGNASLPPGVTLMATALSSSTYTSTLQFSPLSQSHAGNYTCRLGAGRLVNSTLVTVNGIIIAKLAIKHQ